MSLTTQILPHIAGSAFGLLLHSEDVCPIAAAGEPVGDTTDWVVELDLVLRNKAKITIPGTWVSATGPWTINFVADNTTAWPMGEHEVRIAYRAPGVGDTRRFVQPLGLALEVTR